jgi:hypothetical protein
MGKTLELFENLLDEQRILSYNVKYLNDRYVIEYIETYSYETKTVEINGDFFL